MKLGSLPRDTGDQTRSRACRSRGPGWNWVTPPTARCTGGGFLRPAICAPFPDERRTEAKPRAGRQRLGRDANEPPNPGAPALFCRFPTGLGRPLGSQGAPAAGPLQQRGRRDSGSPPGCRAGRPPASRCCESPRRPRPHANKQRVARQLPPGGAAAAALKDRVRASSPAVAARGSGTRQLYPE